MDLTSAKFVRCATVLGIAHPVWIAVLTSMQQAIGPHCSRIACAIVGITTMQCPFSKFTGVQNEEYQECSAVWALAMTILGDTSRKHSYKRVCIQGTKFISGSSVCRSVPMCRHGSENGASCMDCSTNFHTAGNRSISIEDEERSEVRPKWRRVPYEQQLDTDSCKR